MANYLQQYFKNYYATREQRRKQEEAKAAEKAAKKADMIAAIDADEAEKQRQEEIKNYSERNAQKQQNTKPVPVTQQPTKQNVTYHYGNTPTNNGTSAGILGINSSDVVNAKQNAQNQTSQYTKDVALWRDIQLFNSSPIFAQTGITEDMINNRNVPSRNVMAALEILYKGTSGDEQNKAIAPNKEQYDEIVARANANPKGPLSHQIIVYAAKKRKILGNEEKKRQKAYLDSVINGEGFNQPNVKKTKEENVQALVRAMDVAYSAYMTNPEDKEKEAECDALFNEIAYLVKWNETTKILIAEAILKLHNGVAPAWLEDGDMEGIKELMSSDAAEHLNHIRTTDVDRFENEELLWKDTNPAAKGTLIQIKQR